MESGIEALLVDLEGKGLREAAHAKLFRELELNLRQQQRENPFMRLLLKRVFRNQPVVTLFECRYTIDFVKVRYPALGQIRLHQDLTLTLENNAKRSLPRDVYEGLVTQLRRCALAEVEQNEHLSMEHLLRGLVDEYDLILDTELRLQAMLESSPRLERWLTKIMHGQDKVWLGSINAQQAMAGVQFVMYLLPDFTITFKEAETHLVTPANQELTFKLLTPYAQAHFLRLLDEISTPAKTYAFLKMVFSSDYA